MQNLYKYADYFNILTITILKKITLLVYIINK